MSGICVIIVKTQVNKAYMILLLRWR